MCQDQEGTSSYCSTAGYCIQFTDSEELDTTSNRTPPVITLPEEGGSSVVLNARIAYQLCPQDGTAATTTCEP